jgi:hypothetical protein
MLRYTGSPTHPGLRLLVLHDDPEREFAYADGAEKSLEHADREGWTVVSIRNDWSTASPTPAHNSPTPAHNSTRAVEVAIDTEQAPAGSESTQRHQS